jgi:DNA polymerase III sliding clamp (beta) subunit (PCNA family)
MTIGVNGRYVSDIIRFTHSNKLILNVVAEEKPVMFTDEDDSNYRYVIRPILK